MVANGCIGNSPQSHDGYFTKELKKNNESVLAGASSTSAVTRDRRLAAA
jgi:hypothetical protein